MLISYTKQTNQQSKTKHFIMYSSQKTEQHRLTQRKYSATFKIKKGIKSIEDYNTDTWLLKNPTMATKRDGNKWMDASEGGRAARQDIPAGLTRQRWDSRRSVAKKQIKLGIAKDCEYDDNWFKIKKMPWGTTTGYKKKKLLKIVDDSVSDSESDSDSDSDSDSADDDECVWRRVVCLNPYNIPPPILWRDPPTNPSPDWMLIGC